MTARRRPGRPQRRWHPLATSSRALAIAGLCLAGVALVPAGTASADTPGPVPGYDYSHAIQPLAGCETNELPGNDDGFVPDPVPLGFDVNFYGNAFSDLYVNNNGDVTFDGPSSTYSPFPLVDATDAPIIAPFFTDVDTRGPGRTVHYGSGTTSTGQKYFCVDWIEVAQFSENATQGLDDFQLVLYDASGATGGHSGDFDIEFNYDAMPWDHGGAARAGFAAGTGVSGTSLELPGGGTAGAMIDGGPNALVSGSANSATVGRYLFHIRGNGIVNTGSFTGDISNQDGVAIGGARVEACAQSGYCRTAVSSPDGSYSVSNLAAGDYNLTVFPASGSSASPAHGTGTLTSNTDTETVDLQLQEPSPPPAGTTIGNLNGTTSDGLPVIYWGTSHPLSFSACIGARSAQVRFDGFHTDGSAYTSTVTAVEDPSMPGTYRATIPEFDTLQVHGDMTIHYLVDCIGNGPGDVSYTIYIDPSGTVVDQAGEPVVGATVTLLSSDTLDGTYTPVPDGSTLMSPSNRTNPDTTNGEGDYGWDVIAGYYEVRAEKAGCTSNADPGVAYADSGPLSIPPAVTGLILTLNCTGTPVNQPPTVEAGGPYAGTVGSPVALTGTATDPESDPVTTAWSVSSSACTIADPAATSTTVACTVAGTYRLTLSATDGQHPAVTDQATLRVTSGGTGGGGDQGRGLCRNLTTSPGVVVSTDPTTGVTTYTGTSRNDVIVGSSGDDVIDGGNGADVLCGGGGADVIQGGHGRDAVFGQAGDDTLAGGPGRDELYGGMGTDSCDGGPGIDVAHNCESVVSVP